MTRAARALPGLEDLKCMIVDNIKPQVDRLVFPDVHRVIVLLQADHLPVKSFAWHVVPY